MIRFSKKKLGRTSDLQIKITSFAVIENTIWNLYTLNKLFYNFGWCLKITQKLYRTQRDKKSQVEFIWRSKDNNVYLIRASTPIYIQGDATTFERNKIAAQ